MSQFGLMLLLYVICWFKPRSRYESKIEREYDWSKDGAYWIIGGIIFIVVKFFILWHVAGALLPYVHKYVPLI